MREVLARTFAAQAPRPGWMWLNPLLAVLGAVVTLLRVPADVRFVLWAEDGNTFLAQAYERGGANLILEPYAGYMHLVPRLAAWGVRDLVPFVDSAVGMGVLAAVVTSLTALAAFHWSRGWLTLPASVLLWLVTLLIPAAALELAINVADSHWWLMFAAFWALMSRDRGAVSRVAAVTTVIAAALSDPLTAVLVPLAIVRLIGLRSWKEAIVPVSLFVSLALQAFVVMGTERGTALERLTLLRLGHQASLQVGFATVIGGPLGDRIALELPALAVGVGVVVLVATFVGSILVVRRRPLALIAFVSGAASFALIQYLVWPTTRIPADIGPLTWGQRYAFNALLLVATALVAIADGIVVKGRFPVLGRVVAGAIAICLLWPGVVQFQSTGYRPDIPGLAEQMPAAVAACDTHPDAAYPFVTLPHEAYILLVSCDVVLRSAP